MIDIIIIPRAVHPFLNRGRDRSNCLACAGNTLRPTLLAGQWREAGCIYQRAAGLPNSGCMPPVKFSKDHHDSQHDMAHGNKTPNCSQMRNQFVQQTCDQRDDI